MCSHCGSILTDGTTWDSQICSRINNNYCIAVTTIVELDIRNEYWLIYLTQ